MNSQCLPQNCDIHAPTNESNNFTDIIPETHMHFLYNCIHPVNGYLFANCEQLVLTAGLEPVHVASTDELILEADLYEICNNGLLRNDRNTHGGMIRYFRPVQERL